jgi:hypothetical protein
LDPDLKILEVEVNYQACDDELCIFRTENFRFVLDGSESVAVQQIDEASKRRSEALKLKLSGRDYLESTEVKEGTYSYFTIFLLGFFGGLLAFVDPLCLSHDPTHGFILPQAGHFFSTRSCECVDLRFFYRFDLWFVKSAISFY